MALQQISASILSAKQETAVGLASLHFDFSLVKVEPPKEFLRLGKEISTARRLSAEEGQPHSTARKLGALFQNWLPKTPHLIRAYGIRASEIAATPEVNPKGSRSDGIFADHVGIDGTSVWAAATSGPDAIAVHLLACLLARIWTRSEATAIWAELVADRRNQLSTVDETDPLCHLSRDLSRIAITRDQLKEWDDSARSWIQAADEAMRVKQTQLMLIVNNVSLPVNNHPKLYQNVLQAWKSAMIAADNLIQGMPQSVENASVLLGLCSWHIYPDMLVLHESPVPVRQNDPVVQDGAILTIGLQIQRPSGEGVYWSLPLGHLRYYGAPVESGASLGVQGNRVSVTQLNQVAFGSLASTWGFDRTKLAVFTIRLFESIEVNSRDDYDADWLKLFANSLRVLLDGDSVSKKHCEQLMRLGAQRCGTFLQPKAAYELQPVYSLTNIKTFLSMLSIEHSVYYLRKFIHGIARGHQRTYIIRCQNNEVVEFATAFPIPSVEEDPSAIRHARWLDLYPDDPRCIEIKSWGEDPYDFHANDIQIVTDTKRSKTKRFYWVSPPDALSEHSYFIPDGDGKPQKAVKFSFVLGELDRVSLWVSDTSATKPDAQIDGSVLLDVLTEAVASRHLHQNKLFDHLSAWPKNLTNLYTSLRALATVNQVYSSIPDATISLEVTSTPLYKMSWVPIESKSRASASFEYQLDRSHTFSCIALFESGGFLVDPGSLTRVMAMASNASIYISAPLLSDPGECTSDSEIRRIRGSIGKPGIAMLIPAENPQIPDFDKSSWHLASHNPYDGGEEDSFQATTLHLLFTDYVLPIDTGKHGIRDFEIYFQESVISVHDHGRWVADLDILTQLNRDDIYSISSKCTHTQPQDVSTLLPNPRITTVDNFTELLDAPEYVGVVRSSRNWIGRLATTALSIQAGHPTIVLPGAFCWECVQRVWLSQQVYYRPRPKSGRQRGDSPSEQVQKAKGLKRSYDCVSSSDNEGIDLRFDASETDNSSESDSDAIILPNEYVASTAHGSISGKPHRKKRSWVDKKLGEKLADMSGLIIVV
ncbi:hypothetical protein F5B22DRAFT_620195 [Xylaria bambusicola]|uniref:uncharacterized protein n=1 Tax=Xylaria bambusicola TaxID=326684 RepID=UPI002008BEDD|nr:uncharacterized protein F5B22DRAFT_620195 [Xylaria bambusicola]KAI0508540.1 hypothetical protein F5B22DRAFT_620195 [Xylaria bambusicola]